MPTTVTRFVNTASTAGGDGTTNNTSGSNRAYATLAEALAAEARDLPTADEIARFVCEGTAADATAVTFASSAWDTDGARDILVEALSSAAAGRHEGVYSNQKYRIELSTFLIFECEVHVRARGIQIINLRDFSALRGPRANGGGLLDIQECIVAAPDSGSASDVVGIEADGDQAKLLAGNNIVYGWRSSGGNGVGIKVGFTNRSDHKAFHNSVADCDRGLETSASGAVTARNNITDADLGFNGTFHSNSSHNTSADTSAPGSNAETNATIVWANAGARDYHLDASSDGIGTAVDLSGDADMPITQDIDEDARPGSGIDRGADQLAAAGVSGSGGATLTLSGSGDGAVDVEGDGESTITFSAAGAGVLGDVVTGAGGATITLSGSGGGTVPLAPLEGTGGATLALSSSGAGFVSEPIPFPKPVRRPSSYIEIRDDVRAASGSQRLAVIPGLIAGQIRYELGGTHRLSLTWRDEARWQQILHTTRIAYVLDPFGQASEWSIDAIDDARGIGAGRVNAVGVPVYIDLGAELVYEQATGGAARYAIAAELTPAEWIDDHVLPAAQRLGMNYVSRGAIDHTDPVPLELTRETGLGVAQLIASQVGHEFDLARDGDSDWEVRIVEEIGSGAKRVLLLPGRNIRTIGRTRSVRERVARLLVYGLVPEGGTEEATIAEAAFRIVSIDGGNDIVEVGPGGTGLTDEVILEADQFDGMYAQLPDGTLTLIEATLVGPPRLQLATVSGLVVGDDIGIRLDDQRTLLSVLDSPSVMTAMRRPVIGAWQESALRGERNYVPNAFATDWGSPDTAVAYGRADGSQSSTSINLKDLPPGFQIPADSVFLVATNAARRRITASATVAGDGTVTVTLASSVVVNDNATLRIETEAPPPDGWAFASDVDSCVRRDTTVVGDLSGSVSSVPGGDRVVVDSLPANAVIEPGDIITIAGLGAPLVVATRTTADGSGQATIEALGASPASVSAAVTVARPDWDAGLPGGWARGGPNGVLVNPHGIASFANVIDTPSIRVLRVPDLGTLWARLGITYLSPIQQTITGVSPDFLNPVRLQLVSTSPSATLETLEDYDEVTGTRPLQAGATNVIMRIAHEIDQDRTLLLRIRGVWRDAAVVIDDPAVVIRWAMLHLGPDPDVPPIWGAHATALLQRGQRALKQLRREPTTYAVTYRDLAAVIGVEAANEVATLGAMMRLVVPEWGLDADVRTASVAINLVEPELTEILLEAVPLRLTQLVR